VLPLTVAEEQRLLQLAREAVEQAAHYGQLSEIEAPEGVLREKCGAFVTLHKSRSLRGCIGYAEPAKPLFCSVRECAFAAALHDPRFEPVVPDELPDLHIEISVLSPLQVIAPEQIEVGRHGLIVSLGPRRGLLLPQVASSWKWDRSRFLEEACVKAGLPRDAWNRGA
jgi:AmmeMemoRadiSam system protein A